MKINILLVEYDSTIIDTIIPLFHPDVVDFDVAGNESVAKALLKKKKFDMVITEAMLPKSHGFLLCKYVIENYPQIKVIIISEKVDDETHKNEAIQYGASEFIEKPLNKEKLMERVLFHVNVKEKDPMSDSFIQDTTNLYVIPYLAEIKARQDIAKTEEDNFNAIIEMIKKEESNDSFEIDLEEDS
jgi:DNA-binding response OmpR family regulator